MRQLTNKVIKPFICFISKLPMRQLTKVANMIRKPFFSKLPMRQLTGDKFIGYNAKIF